MLCVCVSVCACVLGGGGGGVEGDTVLKFYLYVWKMVSEPYRSQVLMNRFVLFFMSLSTIFQPCLDGSP